MPFSDQTRLLPYLEDELNTTEQQSLAARLAADPGLAAEALRLRRTVDSLREAAARVPNPEAIDHWPALRAHLVLTPKPRRVSAWVLLSAAAALAAVLIAAVVWKPLLHPVHHAAPAAPTVPISVAPTHIAPAAAAPTHAALKVFKPVPYHLLPPPHFLPYLQANPLTLPPVSTPVSKPAPTRLRRRPHRRKPTAKRRLSAPKPGAPRLSVGRIPSAKPHASAPQIITPPPTDAPPPSAPDPTFPATQPKDAPPQ